MHVLVIQGCDGEFRISLRDPRVKKCRKCVLEVGCIGKAANVDLECMEFVTVGSFFSFFPGDGGRYPGAPYFSKK